MTSEKDILITVTDSSFIKGTQVMLYSFLTHNKWFKGDILVLSDEDMHEVINDKIRFAPNLIFKKIDSILLEKIAILKDKDEKYVKNEKAFYCLEVFKYHSYKNVIYIDSDILIKGSLQELIINEHSFIAVADKPFYKDLVRRENDFSSRVSKAEITASDAWKDSLNAGLFVWKPNDSASSIYNHFLESISIETFQKYNGKQQDQFLIYLYFKSVLLLVSAQFNYRFQLHKEILEKDKISYKNASVIHFTGPYKPWNHPIKAFLKLKQLKYIHSFGLFKFTQAKIWIRNKRLLKQEKKQYADLKIFANQEMMDFKNVQTFCLFVGYPRSGHTLVGALLDAHPNSAIATELNIFDLYERGFSKEEIFSLIAERSREMRQNKYVWTDYSYKVFNQFQGELKQAKVMGVKHGGKLANILLKKDVEYISNFKMFAPNLKIIHIIRNPFDIISTRVSRREQQLQKKLSRKGILEIMELQFAQMRIISELKRTNTHDIFDMTNEDFISMPHLNLKNICKFLGLDPRQDYLEDCSSIVFKKPTQTRFKVNWWNDELKSIVQNEINKYGYFSHYSFSDLGNQSAND